MLHKTYTSVAEKYISKHSFLKVNVRCKNRKEAPKLCKRKAKDCARVCSTFKKNWRTAEAYLQKIAAETGQIAFRTFREGTRGALKIAYWNSIGEVNATGAQELLFKRLEVGRKKEDFSAFDIYQYVDKDKRTAFFEEQEEELINVKQDLVGSLLSAQQQVLIFSGNLSWANLQQGKRNYQTYSQNWQNETFLSNL